MSGLSEADHGQFGSSYNYRSDSYSGGSYGSPDQGGGYPPHLHDGRDFRYASMSRMPGSGMETSHRFVSKHKSESVQPNDCSKVMVMG